MKLKNIFLSLVGLGLFMSSFFVVAAKKPLSIPVTYSAGTADLCGTVGMQASSSSTGTITCEAYGSGNLEIKGNKLDLDGTQWIRDVIPATTVSTLGVLSKETGTLKASGISTGGVLSMNIDTGEFIINSSVWSTWKSIYVGIKQASDWGLFLLTSEIVEGTYKTKISLTGKDSTGISHAFAVGGERLSEVPLPASVWLFGSAFVGLMGVARKRTKVA